MAGLIERIKNSDRDGGVGRERRIPHRKGAEGCSSRWRGLTFGRGRRKRNQLVVRFRNTDLLARSSSCTPSRLPLYRKTLDDPFFFRFTGVNQRMLGREGATVCATLFLRQAWNRHCSNLRAVRAHTHVYIYMYTRHLEEIAIFVGRWLNLPEHFPSWKGLCTPDEIPSFVLSFSLSVSLPV